MIPELTASFRPPKSKICRSCKIEKPLSEFYLNAETKDGRTYKCAACLVEADRKKKAAEVEYGKKFFMF